MNPQDVLWISHAEIDEKGLKSRRISHLVLQESQQKFKNEICEVMGHMSIIKNVSKRGQCACILTKTLISDHLPHGPVTPFSPILRNHVPNNLKNPFSLASSLNNVKKRNISGRSTENIYIFHQVISNSPLAFPLYPPQTHPTNHPRHLSTLLSYQHFTPLLTLITSSLTNITNTNWLYNTCHSG